MSEPLFPADMRVAPEAERFWAKVKKTNRCWLWTAALHDNGYGLFFFRGQSRRAHLWAWEQAYGPLPDGLEIDHVRERGCTHRNCVRPSHMEAVTHRENTLRGRGFAAVNARKTHCIRGHEFDAENTYWDCRGRRACRACRRLYRLWRRLRPGGDDAESGGGA